MIHCQRSSTPPSILSFMYKHFVKSPPTQCLVIMIRMLVGEYEHRAVYTRYNVVSSGLDLKLLVRRSILLMFYQKC